MKLNAHPHKNPSIISAGKSLFCIAAMFAAIFVQNGFAQAATNQKPSQLSLLLTSYYHIKDALVDGNADSASSGAEQFVKTANGIDYKIISEGNINALLKDAGEISETGNIGQQRERFANLSANMFVLAEAVRLTTQHVYEMYCPMKKAYWLSSDTAIKNPYFGNAMLTCGSIKETL